MPEVRTSSTSLDVATVRRVVETVDSETFRFMNGGRRVVRKLVRRGVTHMLEIWGRAFKLSGTAFACMLYSKKVSLACDRSLYDRIQFHNSRKSTYPAPRSFLEAGISIVLTDGDFNINAIQTCQSSLVNGSSGTCRLSEGKRGGMMRPWCGFPNYLLVWHIRMCSKQKSENRE